MAVLDVPVDPASPQAQDWIIGELAKPEYQAAKPTWFDIASKAIQDWLTSLLSGPTGRATPILLVVVVLIVVAVVVVTFVIFGPPRLNRRTGEGRRAILGSSDVRSAGELREAAEAAARSGDWVTAIEERFRAIAVGLADRTLVTVSPGTTATEFAARASAVLPEESEALSAAAREFDSVRYLGGSGSEPSYLRLVALDQRLERARPILLRVAP